MADMEEEVGQQFEFVILSQPSDQRERGTKTRVRSKAARHWNSERRRKSRGNALSSRVSPRATDEDRQPKASSDDRRRDLVVSPKSIFTPGWVDFGPPAATTGSRERVNFLFDHFVKIFSLFVSSVDSRSSVVAEAFVPFALHDAAVTDGLNACAAMHRYALNKEGFYLADSKSCTTIGLPDVLNYRGQLLRSINAKLQDPSEALTDRSISCLMAMIAFECMSDDHSSIPVHEKALSYIIGLRGGLDRLARPLATMILMGITKSAIMAWQYPLLCPDISSVTLDVSKILPPAIIYCLRKLGSGFMIRYSSSPGMLEPISKFIDATMIVAAIHARRVHLSVPQQREVVYARTCAENSLIAISIDFATAVETNPSLCNTETLLAQATRLALFVYSACFMTVDYPGTSSSIAPDGMRTLIGRVLVIAEAIVPRICDGEQRLDAIDARLLLWICWTGAVSAVVKQRDSFLGLLRDLRHHVGVGGVEEVEMLLGNWLFVDSLHGAFLRDVWHDVER